MRVKDDDRVVSKVFKIIDLFIRNKSVTTEDIVTHTGMSKRSAQRYIKDAVENIELKKNDDGSYSLPEKSNIYSIVRRNDAFLTTTLLQYGKSLFPEDRYDAIERFYNLFNLKNMSSAIKVLETSSLDYGKIEEIMLDLDYFLKYPHLKIEFTYLKNNTQKQTTPYRILFYHGFWYLIGVNDREEIRSYRIDYISNIRTNGEKSIPISDKTKEIVENTTSIWFGTEKKEVEIELDQWITEYFTERSVFKNMEIISEDPFIIKVTVYNYMSLYMELMPFAPYFKIITKEARQYFYEKLMEAAERNK